VIRQRWTASVTYVFRENVKNNELAVNPLGLTIVRFRAEQAFSWRRTDHRRAFFMSFLAANPAGFSYLSPCLVERANAGLSTGNNDGELRPSYGGHACSYRTAIAASFRSQCSDENFARELVCRYVSRPLLGHRFGVLPAPRRHSVFCFAFSPQQANTALSRDPDLRAPSGSRFLPKQVCNRRHKTPRKLLSGPPRKQTFVLGSRTPR